MHSVGRAAAYSVAFASRALSSRLSKRSALSGVLFVLNPLSPLRDPILDLARQGHCTAASEDISKQQVTWNRKGWEPPPFLSSFWELRLSGYPPKRRKGSQAVQPRCVHSPGLLWESAGDPLGDRSGPCFDQFESSPSGVLFQNGERRKGGPFVTTK